jgi:hypothetical protein
MENGAIWQTFSRPPLEEGGPHQVLFKVASYVVNRRTLDSPCDYLAARGTGTTVVRI